MCVCEREGEKERETVCGCARCVCVCVEEEEERERESVCVEEEERERERLTNGVTSTGFRPLMAKKSICSCPCCYHSLVHRTVPCRRCECKVWYWRQS